MGKSLKMIRFHYSLMNTWKLSLNNYFKTMSKAWINLFAIKKVTFLMNERIEFHTESTPFSKDEKLVLLLEKLVQILKHLKR
jgi:hypothetical protein